MTLAPALEPSTPDAEPTPSLAWLSPETAAELQSIVIEAARAVLKTHGVSARPPVVSPRCITSCITFRSDTFEGALSLCVSTSFVSSSYEARLGRAASTDQLLDWAGELTNLLLGRVKSGLLERGVTVCMTTPRAELLERVEARAPAGSVCFLHFGTPYEAFLVALDAAPLADGALVLGPLTQPPPEEGTLLLF